MLNKTIYIENLTKCLVHLMITSPKIAAATILCESYGHDKDGNRDETRSFTDVG